MSGEKALNADVSNLNFLYKKCSMSYDCMKAWLSVPEFCEQIESLRSRGDEINNAVVLPIAEEILEQKRQNRKANSDFPFQNARRGINQLKRSLGIEVP